MLLVVAGLLLLSGIAASMAPASGRAVSFPSRSCWVRRPNPGYPPTRPIESALSVLAPAPRHRVDPSTLVEATLRRFGDHSIISSARLGQLPAVVRQHRRGWFGPAPQPKNPLWIYVHAQVLTVAGTQSPRTVVRGTREQWELDLLAGALHDQACEARTDPIVGASIPAAFRPEMTVFMSGGPFGQRFPNPSKQSLRRRATGVAKTFHSRLAAMWFLHPLQQAPVIVFEASDTTRFIQNFAAIYQQLGLRTGNSQRYEGVFIEAVDKNHIPFMLTWSVSRGEQGGGEWTSDHCHYPFPTLGSPGGTKPGCNG
jgi:hypothetical protein